MKQEYKTPVMKVRTIGSSHMLCQGSLNSVGINEESVSEGENKYRGQNGYGEGW